jgi:tagaturonate reductase
MDLLNKKLLIEQNLVAASKLHLPEKILQFGTGVFLRGMPVYLIDQANKNGSYHGSIVIVKSLGAVEPEYVAQDSAYTLRQRGIVHGKSVTETVIITSVSRVVSATTDWAQLLKLAGNPDLELVLSNTTEAGLIFQSEDIFQDPPQSFPAKLTAFLYERFLIFEGATIRGLTVVPTELVIDNGRLLKQYVLQHAQQNKLGTGFENWIDQSCDFCDSLVDRIVTGKPATAEKTICWQNWGYQDDLCIDSETFILWAIACTGRAKARLTQCLGGHPSVVLRRDISTFREQKLRLLNGGHTISVALAYLLGLNTVKEMMQHTYMNAFVRRVLSDEILKTLSNIPTAEAFANAVIDRFCNPFIEHQLLSITFQNSAKMLSRNALTFQRYHAQTGQIPYLMSVGFAGYLLFSRAAKQEKGIFFGKRPFSEDFYKIADDKAAFLNEHWQNVAQNDAGSLTQFVNEVLEDERIFEKNSFKMAGFASQVGEILSQMLQNGVQLFIDKK